MSSATSAAIPAVLIAGGQQLDNKIFKTIIAPTFEQCPNPKVAYIGTANGDRESFFEMVYALFVKAGIRCVDFLHLARADADVAAARETLARADVIFLSGGEVFDGIDWLRKHRLVNMLKALYDKGTQFIGISAGAIMIGANWVRIGIPEDNESTHKLMQWVAGESCPEIDANIELFECLGLVRATFDTHAEHEDWVELKAALRLMGDNSCGYGIPRGGIIKAIDKNARAGSVHLENLEKEYLTFTLKKGEYHIT